MTSDRRRRKERNNRNDILQSYFSFGIIFHLERDVFFIVSPRFSHLFLDRSVFVYVPSQSVHRVSFVFYNLHFLIVSLLFSDCVHLYLKFQVGEMRSGYC